MNSNCGSDYSSLIDCTGEIDKVGFHNLIDQMNNQSGDSKRSPYFCRDEIRSGQEHQDISSIKEEPSEGMIYRS